MDGKTHAFASLFASVPVGVLGGVIASQLDLPSDLLGVASAVGCLSGVIFSPDLDQRDLTIAEWLPIKALGPFGGIGLLWAAVWWLYAWLIPHRSFFSHFPVVGTVVRVAYLGLHAYVVLYALDRFYGQGHVEVLGEILTNPIFLFACGGLMVSDALHWIMDTWGGS